MLRPFLIALQFLTVLPSGMDGKPDAEATGRSLLYYPLVGLLIGVILVATAWVFGDAPPQLGAAVVLTVWVALTGALHLDGLADSTDASVGGYGDREKTLAIMKDPRSGPMAVVTLVLVLLLKFTALVQLVTNGAWEILMLVPVLGRTAPVLLFLTTPYVQSQGIGSALASHLPRRACASVVVVALLAAPAFIGLAALWLLAAFAVVFLALRRLMLRRLGGTTGDTAGSLVEITETVALLTVALVN